MRIAFYAPLKSPDHPTPSGDRRMGRLLFRALEVAGHEVGLASRLRSWDRDGDQRRQGRLANIGSRVAARLIRNGGFAASSHRPDLWFTYHLYYKAPDWIGPKVAQLLGIPYVVAEASVAQKRAGGPWDQGHRATLEALAQATTIIALNTADVAALPDPGRVRYLRPFLDERPFFAASASRETCRRDLAARHRIDPARPWILIVAMMRPGDKMASYGVAAKVLRRLKELPWHLLVVGDGPEKESVAQLFDDSASGRWTALGEQAPDDLPGLMAACDLLLWPAVNEAYGMALLEAQSCGLPVVAGNVGGVPDIVADGETAYLCNPDDADSQAEALARLLEDPRRRETMGKAAQRRVESLHGLNAGAVSLNRIVMQAAGAA